MSQGQNVLVGVTGSIAAYKAAEVVRGFQKASKNVRVVMTPSATKFIAPLTFEALTRHEVEVDVVSPQNALSHIDLADWADLVVVAPATAQSIARFSHGFADEMVSAVVLATTSPILIAPAMNVHMYENEVTQENLKRLAELEFHIVEPLSGNLACGYTGSGKLEDPEKIVKVGLELLTSKSKGQLENKHILVTAGPTYEAIDPVRFLGNRSSGKMGYAIVEALLGMGASVSLVSGPTSLTPPQKATYIPVESTEEMYEASLKAFESADAAICAAAVSDFKPAITFDKKIKKENQYLQFIPLEKTPDILAKLCEIRGDRPVIGFAAETNNLIEQARRKLVSKDASLIVANDVSKSESTFGSDTNNVILISESSERPLGVLSKQETAVKIAEELLLLLSK